MKKKVIGIGGIFFKTENQQNIRNWYAEHLGIESETWGATFPWRRADAPEQLTYSAWSPFTKESTYFAPSEKPFMINYQVEDLDALLIGLKNEGIQIIDTSEDLQFGKFAWILDPEGNKIELWEAPNES